MPLALEWRVLHAASPTWLLVLALLPSFFLGAGRRRPLAAACRALAAAAIVLVLAGLTYERARPEAGTCVIAVIDVSASVQRAGIESARAFLNALAPALGTRDLVGSVAFATNARIVARPRPSPARIADLLPPDPVDLTGLETGETDLAAALTTASALCPADKAVSIVLFTDGNETVGSVLAEAALTEPRVPVFAVVPPPTTLPSAQIRRLLVPPFAAARSAPPVEVVVESRSATPLEATLTLTANGTPLVREPVGLPPGLHSIALPYRPTAPGQYLIEVELALLGERSRAQAAVAVTPPLHVLVVSERTAPVAAAALAERGMVVERIAPPAFAAHVARLADYHVVVLDDAARAGFADGDLAALATWVAGGGGLIVSGGPHLFGDPALAASPLARVLPIELHDQVPEPQEREPLALYLVIDRSNSMGYGSTEPTVRNGEKMEYAKRAALAVLAQLGPRDLVGAVAFDAQPYDLGGLCAVQDCRPELSAKIRQLRYGGGTDFKEALDIARRNLVESGRDVRHVILLTDGDTNRNAIDHAALIAALAQAEITVTSIRIGADTINLELLDAIARATGGEFHHVEHVQALPQLMIRDAQQLMARAGESRPTPARIGEPGTILAGIDESELPPAAGWARTRPKGGAELRLYVEAGSRRDPLLATWQYELGRVAAVPLDFHGSAATWTAWDGFGKVWAQLAAWTAPPGLASDYRLAARRVRAGTLVTLDTVGTAAGPFALRLPSSDRVVLRRTGMRTFAATVPGLHAGPQAAVLEIGSGTDARERPVELVVPATAANPREHHPQPPNVDLLARVTRLTGATLDPDPASVLAARAGARHEAVPLEWILVPLALAAILGDVALRRLGS